MKDDAGNEMVDVSREAVASLAAKAAASVDGVVACQRKTVDRLTSRVKREFVHKGVEVERDDNGAYHLSFYVHVRYGADIAALAKTLRERIKEYLEGLTEIEVSDIEVIVEDIEIPAEQGAVSQD
jgi:uncharacterized alkaline shock family protein YloU